MRSSALPTSLLALWALSCAAEAATVKPVAPDSAPAYPATRTVDVKDVIHGVEVKDPYRWLEEEKSPEVQGWMKAQDELARGVLAKLPGRDAIAARLRKLFYVDELGPPARKGTRFFWSRTHADKEKAVFYWKEGKDGKAQVLFDPNGWSKDGSVSLGDYSVTEDGKTVAFTVKQNNSDEATMYVMDVATQKRSAVDVIEGAKYASASWTPDGKGFYYTWLPVDPKIPASERPGYAEVRFHALGQDPRKDAIVREKTGDPTKFLGAGLSRDGRWLILVLSHGWTSHDVWFKDLAAKDAKWIPLSVGQPFHYSVDVWKDRFYVTTDEGAPKFRVFKVDPTQPGGAERKAWKEIIPERADATLEGTGVVGGHLSASYLKNAVSELRVLDLDGKLVREVKLPGVGSAWGLFGREDDDEAYYGFSTYTVPREIWVTSVKTGESRLWAKLEVDVDPSPYTVDQIFYPSKDGTKVSMFLVHRKDWKKDGRNPTLLTGYGGFSSPMLPHFSGWLYPWLERGGVFAVPNLRGGNEYGEGWHRDGMLEKKQNVFDDFAAAAQWLAKEKITSPDRLAVMGGSNGGLLVGALTTQHPELVKAVVCQVPLLDMVRYHRFGSGKTWVSEYGSADDPRLFPVLHAYSPYHRVEKGKRYPALLMDSADSDDRVDPLHARKMTAALQAATSGGPVLLRIERHSGHGGADMRKAAVEQSADEWAFVAWQLGVAEAAGK